MSNSHRGKILKETHKQNISLSLKNKPKTKEHNLKVSLANKGKIHSKESYKIAGEKLKNKFKGDKNPAAIIVKIFSPNNELRYICNGNFEKTCKNNNLPTKALRNSYYNNGKPIYQGHTIKKEVLNKNKEFIGWYAIKL